MGKAIQQVNAERKRQYYSKAFKLASVWLLHSGKKSGTLIAMELGIQRNLLYKWNETLKLYGGNTESVFQGLGRNKLLGSP
jgi:transposase-like protein